MGELIGEEMTPETTAVRPKRMMVSFMMIVLEFEVRSCVVELSDADEFISRERRATPSNL